MKCTDCAQNDAKDHVAAMRNKVAVSAKSYWPGGIMGITSRTVVLHVEDDWSFVSLLQMAFDSLGFEGRLVPAGSLREALALLADFERSRQQIHLALVDIQLPDGTGIDFIRAMKTSLWWKHTPVIVLSGESDPEIVDAAYSLGANCFISKLPQTTTLLESVEALYHTWMKGALIPPAPVMDRVQSAIARGVENRAHAAALFLEATRASITTPEAGFWLDRYITEGNMLNLLSFIKPLLHEGDIPSELVERWERMQEQTRRGWQRAESNLRALAAPQLRDHCAAAMELFNGLDVMVLMDLLKCVFTMTPEAASSLQRCIAGQLDALASHTLDNCTDDRVCESAQNLQAYASQLLSSCPPA